MKKRKIYDDMLKVIATFDERKAQEFERRMRQEEEFDALVRDMGDAAVLMLDPLPNDILEIILSFLTLGDVRAICSTSKSFRKFCKDRNLEKRLIAQGAAYGLKLTSAGSFSKLIPTEAQGQIVQISTAYWRTVFVTRDGRAFWFRTHKSGDIPQLIPHHTQGQIVQVSVGDEHIAFVTRDGDAFWFSRRIGGGGIPRSIPTHTQGQIVQISTGTRRFAFVTRDGRAFWFRMQTYFGIPELIPTEAQGQIVQISAGSDHFAFVTRDGRAFAFGIGRSGNLGDNDTDPHQVAIPQLILTEVQGQIVQISAGGHHTAFVTRDGRAFAFGQGLYGRLGDNDTRAHEVAIPQLILTEAQGQIVQISAGVYHTAFVTRDGRAFVVGQNIGGIPQLIQTEAQGQIVQISAGDNYIAFVSSKPFFAQVSCKVCGSSQISSCAGCKKIKYCSKNCQTKDWFAGKHAKVCSILRKL